tara:strand:- start:2848 stop:3180 length:333 start_codon:yes stop_codon:yes gene_type:complete
MDITLIAIAFFILLAVVLLVSFLLKSINKKSFVASDGSVFSNQSDLDLYEILYEKTKSLFSATEDSASSMLKLGFEKSFLTKLTKDGFPDLKTLVKDRKQFKLLSELINT